MAKWIVSLLWSIRGKTPQYSVSKERTRTIIGSVTSYAIWENVAGGLSVVAKDLTYNTARDFLIQREPWNPWLF
jgi:hypothetical protein